MNRYLNALLDLMAVLYRNIFDFIALYADILILILIIFILLLWVIPEQPAKGSQIIGPKQNEGADEATDYDFMATHESIPAQFDLVIALSNMGKTDEAFQILRTLSTHAHPGARKRAARMLEMLSAQQQALQHGD